jgi:hypothetical protein
MVAGPSGSFRRSATSAKVVTLAIVKLGLWSRGLRLNRNRMLEMLQPLRDLDYKLALAYK